VNIFQKTYQLQVAAKLLDVGSDLETPLSNDEKFDDNDFTFFIPEELTQPYWKQSC